MAWTELTRRQHDRKGDKYASDMTGAEMGVDSAFDAAAQDNWPASHDRFARRVGRDPHHRNDRMPVAHVAE